MVHAVHSMHLKIQWLSQRAMGQDHIYRCLVGEVADQHGAVCDAMKSMHLYHLYKHLEKDVDEHKKALVSPC